jgi:two-component system OmpR family response regulator
MLVNYLKRADFEANWVPDAQGLFRRITKSEPDLVVLDPQLDSSHGLEFLQRVHQKSTVPIIILSDRDTNEIDAVSALELGADDYIRKPVSLLELTARIRAKLRRRLLHRSGLIRGRRYFFDGWVLDKPRRQLLSPEGNDVKLGERQFALLSAFVQAPGTILSRLQLLNVTGMSEDVVDRSVDQHVFRLRRKLRDQSPGPRLIRAERGAGYVFEAEVRTI